VQLFHRIVQLSGELNTPVAPPPTMAILTLPLAPRLEYFSGTGSAFPDGNDAPGAGYRGKCSSLSRPGVKVVRGTAQRHHQRVVRQFTLGNQQLAFLVTQLGQRDGFASRLISTTEPSWNWKPWLRAWAR
jgi:hypothetical protein